MKKSCLLIVTSLLFFLLSSCENSAEIAALSAYTWVITADSPNGTIGNEYVFHDNRLFFATINNTVIDGQWEFDPNNSRYISIRTDISLDTYTYQVNGKNLTLELIGGVVATEYKLVAKE